MLHVFVIRFFQTLFDHAAWWSDEGRRMDIVPWLFGTLLAPVIAGEAFRLLVANPVAERLGQASFPAGTGLPLLLMVSVGLGLACYVGTVAVRLATGAQDASGVRLERPPLSELLEPDSYSLYLVSVLPGRLLAPWLSLMLFLVAAYVLLMLLLGEPI
ncbi:MAG: hypothetical protein F4Y02_13835 [Chloroflexi bacterium]|nr:hypothetical protein [Chloroflexota bacterium]